MQYVFPVYIWSIMAIIIVFARHSTKLTKILGDRATLFLLSYAKVLQTIIASISLTPLKVFGIDNNKINSVWSLDGDYVYCHFPHALLFIAALSIFFLLWLPYTLVLVSIQYLRRNSGKIILLHWVPKFTPVFDAHLQPLKHKHHYWFGTLLIARGVMLITFTYTYTTFPNVNFVLLLVTSSLLLCYSNYHRVYKDKLVQINENFFLFLLVIVGASGFLQEQTRCFITYASIGAGILGFCGLIIGRKLFQICCNKRKGKRNYDIPNFNECRQKVHQGVSGDTQYRDSILNETEPLLSDINTY